METQIKSSNVARLTCLALMVMMALVWAAPARAQDYIAMVIGNEDYPDLGSLPFAQTNADQITDALSSVGFTSHVEGEDLEPMIDLSHQALADELIKFSERFKTMPKGSVGFLYFAGHGIARERRGDVYLLSTDSKLKAGGALDRVGLPVADVVQLLRSTPDRTLVIVVDACRNVMPESAKLTSSVANAFTPAPPPAIDLSSGGQTQTRGVEVTGGGWGQGSGKVGLMKRGFKRDRALHTRKRADYFIAFSTSPDRVAYDNDVFSSTLAEEIKRGRHDLLTLFKEVGERVAIETSASGDLQLPTFEVGIYNAAPCFGSCPRSSAPNDLFFDCPGCPWIKSLTGGEFTYGSPKTEKGRGKKEPVAELRNVAQFDIGAYEVTRAEWRACEQAGACRKLLNKNEWQSTRAPIGGVTYQDAQDYLAWLSQESGATYRLPTTEEWEYAARGDTTTAFMTGDKIEPSEASFDYSASYGGSRRAEYRGAAEATGSFDPNAFDLYDMHGNMWEWACSRYEGETCVDPVLRGGSYKSTPKGLRSANAMTIKLKSKREDVGLRVVRVENAAVAQAPAE